jgi:hypothetical protein
MSAPVLIDLTAGLAVRPDGTIDPDLIDRAVAHHLSRDINDLSPVACQAANDALNECEQAGHSLIVLETYREDDVERAYWRKGRDAQGNIVRLDEIVTHSMDGSHSWHSYGLALDLSGLTHDSIAIFEKHGFSAGANWPHHPDYPHMQWGKCPYSPTQADEDDYHNGDQESVWDRYGANA